MNACCDRSAPDETGERDGRPPARRQPTGVTSQTSFAWSSGAGAGGPAISAPSTRSPAACCRSASVRDQNRAVLNGADKVYVGRIRLARAPTLLTQRGRRGDGAGAPTTVRTWNRFGNAFSARSPDPPMYSALKRNGTPLYQLARRASRSNAHRVRSYSRPRVVLDRRVAAAFSVSCSKGTYVRVLAEDLAAASHRRSPRNVATDALGSFRIEDAWVSNLAGGALLWSVCGRRCPTCASFASTPVVRSNCGAGRRRAGRARGVTPPKRRKCRSERRTRAVIVMGPPVAGALHGSSPARRA